MDDKNLKIDYFWNTLGVFLQTAVGPILLIFVTRLNGIFDSGIFSFALATAIIFWSFGMWGGRTYQVSDIKNEFSQNSYIVARIMLAIVMIISVVSFVYINRYDSHKSLAIILLVLFKSIESITDSLYGVIQRNNELYKTGISLTLKSIIGSITFLIIDLRTRNLILSITALLLVNLIIIIFYDFRVLRKSGELTGKKHLKKIVAESVKMLKKSWAIFAVVFFVMFTLNIPRYYLDKFMPNEVGYFGIIAMPMTVISLFMVFILQPNVIKLSKLLEDRRLSLFNKKVTNLGCFIGAIGLLGILGIALFGTQLLSFIFTVDLNNFHKELTLITIGGVFSALVSMFINILIIMRKFKAQLLVIIVTNALLIALSIKYIRHFGMIATVLLYTIVSVAQFLLLFSVYFLTVNKLRKIEMGNNLKG